MMILIAYCIGMNLKRPLNIGEFCNFCWEMAKNAPFHIKSPVKNFHGRAKGAASHRAPPLNTPLVGLFVKFSSLFCFILLVTAQ